MPSPNHTVSHERSSFWPLTVVVLFSCAVNFPCLWWGLQFGDDHNLHLTYLHFFGAQLRDGELYPHWISGMNFGAGSPIFFVQYPLPFYAATSLRWLFRFSATPVGQAHALGLFMFFTGIAGGVSSWLWCRALSNPRAAVFASAAFLTMPYVYGCDVYYRGAIGEYSALAWVPLALFFAHKIDTRPVRAMAGMAFAFALIVLSNLFTAILIAPFLILYTLYRAPRARAGITALYAMAALALGVGLAGFYFLPMNVHRAFFSLANLVKLGPGIFFYKDHLFPFGQALFPTFSRSMKVADLITAVLALVIVALLLFRLRRAQTSKWLACAAVACVLATCAAPLWHRIGLVPHPEVASARVVDVRSRIFLISFLTLEAALLAFAALRNNKDILPKFLLVSSLVCFFLSTRWSEPIWNHAAFLWNIQFPWRLTGLLSVFATGLLSLALRDVWDSPTRRKNMLLAGAGLWLLLGACSYLALGIGGRLTRPFSTEFKSKVETAYPTYATISKLPTADELGPNDGLAGGVLLVAGEGSAVLDRVSARHLQLTTDCQSPCTLLLKLVYYPLWQARDASGQPIPLQPSKRAGLTELSLSPGAHDVRLELPIGRSETWGAALSAISLLVAVMLFVMSAQRLQRAA